MRKFLPEQWIVFRHLLYWTVLIVPLSVAAGTAVAFFLWSLDLVTTTRWNHPWLLFLLPLAGILIRFLYQRYGKKAVAGNNLIIDEIHRPGGGIPFRMAPLVLLSTLLTHLCGGSAGREGTAVQIGGSLSALFVGWYRLPPDHRQILLMCGMAAGFGAVFGTPVAGAVFALEVLAIGSIRYNALLPCLMASVLAHLVCAAFGIHHTHYAILFTTDPGAWLLFHSVDIGLLVKVIAAGALFGLAARLFSEAAHQISSLADRFIPHPWLVPVTGGLLVIGISCTLRTSDYLGLGVVQPAGGTSITAAFATGGADTWSWLWKLLLTAITLGTGFKGGEVTPLFFIGATLGNTLALLSGAPVDLFAGLGFIAVFAGATNTPLACTLMGVELFGSQHLLYHAVACFTAYYFSGHTGIYRSQRVAVSKFAQTVTGERSLGDWQKDPGQ